MLTSNERSSKKDFLILTTTTGDNVKASVNANGDVKSITVDGKLLDTTGIEFMVSDLLCRSETVLLLSDGYSEGHSEGPSPSNHGAGGLRRR